MAKELHHEEIMKYFSSYEWAIIEIFHNKLNLARDFDRENMACNMADVYRDELRDAWNKHVDYWRIADNLFNKFVAEHNDELECLPQNVENPKVGDVVYACAGCPNRKNFYTCGEISKIEYTLTNPVYWLKDCEHPFDYVIKPNEKFKHLSVEYMEVLNTLVSNYIEDRFNNHDEDYKTINKFNLFKFVIKNYNDLRNKEN